MEAWFVEILADALHLSRALLFSAATPPAMHLCLLPVTMATPPPETASVLHAC